MIELRADQPMPHTSTAEQTKDDQQVREELKRFGEDLQRIGDKIAAGGCAVALLAAILLAIILIANSIF